jgi:hypothetical protein
MVWNSLDHGGSTDSANPLSTTDRHKDVDIPECLHQRGVAIDAKRFTRPPQGDFIERLLLSATQVRLNPSN